MSIDHALEFLKKMAVDNAFADEVMQADHMALVEILNRSGWSFNEDELFKAAERLSELSDDELDSITGGLSGGRRGLPASEVLGKIGGKLSGRFL
jgi:bacteriocin propeptide, TIGR03798 family